MQPRADWGALDDYLAERISLERLSERLGCNIAELQGLSGLLARLEQAEQEKEDMHVAATGNRTEREILSARLVYAEAAHEKLAREGGARAEEQQARLEQAERERDALREALRYARKCILVEAQGHGPPPDFGIIDKALRGASAPRTGT